MSETPQTDGTARSAAELPDYWRSQAAFYTLTPEIQTTLRACANALDAALRASSAPVEARSQDDLKRKADEAGTAMFALWDELKALGRGFDTWSDVTKGAVSAALIDHRQPTAADMEAARRTAERLGLVSTEQPIPPAPAVSEER